LPVELMLVDRDGTILVGPEDLEGTRLAAPATIQRGRDRRLFLTAASVTPKSKDDPTPAWSTLARTRADLAFAPAAALQRDILWASLLLALAGIAAGWVLGTRHALPLEALTRAAQEIARGNDRAELPPLDDNPEIERLARALRAMLLRLRMQAAALEDAQEHLQRRVHERTAELVKLQAELQLEVAEAKLARDDLARAHEELARALAGRERPIVQVRLSQ
jgi:methyl-accepting chemotaxis protein